MASETVKTDGIIKPRHQPWLFMGSPLFAVEELAAQGLHYYWMGLQPYRL